MDLFNNQIKSSTNLLPKDGIVNYYGNLLNRKETDNYFDSLMNTIEWKNDQVKIYGKLILTKRKVAWYGDSDFEYTYSNITKQALPWTEELWQLKLLTEEKTGEKFNSCLLNLYHNGHEGMGWHSDAEKVLKQHAAIASLSFGAARKFVFKHKATKETVSLILENGSLLLMKGTVQTNWLHQLPPALKISNPRINLTFRTIDL